VTTDVTTVRLPHTGLHVPDLSLTITGYREHATTDGLAFNAKLRHNKQIVGVVENHGTGGMTFFYASNPATFGETHLEAYAGQCRNELSFGGAHKTGYGLTTEWLLDELVEEADWARKVTQAANRARMPLRLLDASTDGIRPYALRAGDCAIPASDREWTAIGKSIAEHKAMKPDHQQWWQGWNGRFWRDVTARPKTVDVNLCH
jgi:hypothetical protein